MIFIPMLIARSITRNPWQLLVATILSAQCTDVRVNIVTRQLFKQFPTPVELAQASQGEVEELIRSTGFFSQQGTKPDSLRPGRSLPCTRDRYHRILHHSSLSAESGARPPMSYSETHSVSPEWLWIPMSERLAGRFGWTASADPVRIEQDLMKLLPVRTGHRAAIF